MLQLLSELHRDDRFACLFISRDLAVVDAMADCIVLLNRGKIAEQGTRDEILRAPKETYTQRLVAVIPVPTSGHGPRAAHFGITSHQVARNGQQGSAPTRTRDLAEVAA